MEKTLLTRRPAMTASALAAAAAVPLMLALLVLQMGQIFAVDDFYYAAYWREGISGFLSLNVRHYNTMNGRALVHAVAESVMAFGSEELCGVVGMLFLLAAGVLAWRALGAGKMSGPLGFSLPMAALLLLLAPGTLRETLLWPSAYYNYVFPMVLLMAQIWAMDYTVIHGKGFLLCALTSLLAGATTELYGLMSVILVCAVALARLLHTREHWARLLLAPVCTGLGLLTVLLSPATRGRAEHEIAASAGALIRTYLTRMSRMAEVLFGPEGSAALFLTVLFGAAVLLGVLKRERRWLTLWAVPAAALWAIPSVRARFAAALLVTAALAVTLLFQEGLEKAGALLSAGGCAVLIICMTDSVAPRTAFPFLFSVCLVTGRLWAEALEEWDRRAAEGPRRRGLLAGCGAVLTLTVVAVLAVYAPTGRGVAANAALDRANRASAQEAVRTGGECWYSVDYDRTYCHTGMYEMGVSYQGYLDYWGLQNSDMWFTSETLPYVTVNGQRIRKLAAFGPEEAGTQLCLPMPDVFAALGGVALWEGDVFSMELDGLRCSWKEDRCTYTDQRGQQREVVACAARGSSMSTWLPAELLSEVFGVQSEYDAEENCCRLTYR